MLFNNNPGVYVTNISTKCQRENMKRRLGKQSARSERLLIQSSLLKVKPQNTLLKRNKIAVYKRNLSQRTVPAANWPVNITLTYNNPEK